MLKYEEKNLPCLVFADLDELGEKNARLTTEDKCGLRWERRHRALDLIGEVSARL